MPNKICHGNHKSTMQESFQNGESGTLRTSHREKEGKLPASVEDIPSAKKKAKHVLPSPSFSFSLHYSAYTPLVLLLLSRISREIEVARDFRLSLQAQSGLPRRPTFSRFRFSLSFSARRLWFSPLHLQSASSRPAVPKCNLYRPCTVRIPEF